MTQNFFLQQVANTIDNNCLKASFLLFLQDQIDDC